MDLDSPCAMDASRSFFLPGGPPDAIVLAFEDARRFAVEHEPFVQVTIEKRNTLCKHGWCGNRVRAPRDPRCN